MRHRAFSGRRLSTTVIVALVLVLLAVVVYATTYANLDLVPNVDDLTNFDLLTTDPPAAPLFMAGAESGDTGEVTGQGGTASPQIAVSTTQKTLGAYSYWLNTGGVADYIETKGGLNSAAVYERAWVWSNWVASGSTLAGLLMNIQTGGGTWLASVNWTITTGGVLTIQALSGGTPFGSTATLTPSTWNCVELFYQKGTGANGIVTMTLNGTPIATTNTSTQTSNADHLDFGLYNNSGGTVASGATYIDDLIAGTSEPGCGYNIARQPSTATSTYNDWARVGTSTIYGAWNTTPFNGATHIAAVNTGFNQTGVPDFTLTGGTGSTGFGTGVVDAGATINGFAVGMAGQTTTAGDGPDQSLTLIGGTPNAYPFSAGWATSPADSFQLNIFPTVPSAANIRSGLEYGVEHNLTTNQHNIDDAWAFVDFVPGAAPTPTPTPTVTPTATPTATATSSTTPTATPTTYFFSQRAQELVRR